MAMGTQSVQVLGLQIPVSNLVSVEVTKFGCPSSFPASFFLSGVVASQETQNHLLMAQPGHCPQYRAFLVKRSLQPGDDLGVTPWAQRPPWDRGSPAAA